MSGTPHSTLTGADLHAIHRWTYADQATREAASGFTAGDVGKVAWQQDEDSLWLLIDDSPATWVAFDAAARAAVAAHIALTAAHGASGAVVGTTNAQTLTNKTLTAPVVNAPTGIAKADVGLGNVDNTSDATKNAAAVTLTNKTLTAPTIGDLTNMQHDHLDADDGGTLTPSAVSGFDTQVRTSRLDQMAAPTGAIDINGQLLSDVANPVGPQDAATKDYVDDQIAVVGVAQRSSAVFVIDGGGATIATGEPGFLFRFPWDGEIVAVELFGKPGETGSIVIDLWVDEYANYPPTNADSITSATPPTISAATKAQDATLTGWTVAFVEGDVMIGNVDSVATFTRVALVVTMERTA